MSLTRKLSYSAAAAALFALAAPAAVHAQQITSNIRGSVTTEDGAPIQGASVVIVHTPTGTASSTVTGATGRYNATGLRVGGPYTVTVTAPGYNGERVEGLFAAAGEFVDVPVSLSSGAAQDVIVVTASALNLGGLATGPSESFNIDDINGLPSISRDPRDLARISGFANLDPENGDALSVAGSNNRYNSFTVDGVTQNDLFGLNSSGFPAENRGPVSIDALESLSLEVAPYDVQFSGFTGGTLNAVTRSGTNEFHGSLAYFWTNDSYVGDRTEGVNLTSADFEESTWTATFGGPIIEDRLFFFMSYELFERTDPLGEAPAGGPAAQFTETRVTQAEVDQILGIMQNVYGLDLTNFNEADLANEDEKILVTFDWNINEDHRVKFTYNSNDGTSTQERNDGASIGTPSTWYNRAEQTETFALQLLSDWTDNFSTEVRIARSTQQTGQNSYDGADIANFQIRTPTGGTVSVGPDFFRHANELENELTQFLVRGEYVAGDHVLSAGFERRDQQTFNLFVPGSEGSYDFDSITDLQNQTASALFYQNAVSNNEDDGAANWEYAVNSFYLQDEVTWSDALTLIFGVRYEQYSASNNITPNAQFLARTGYTNTTTIDGLDIWMPRFSFNYAWDPEFGFGLLQTTGITLRGGYGSFSGGSPAVWISNSYSNDGVTIDSVFIPGPITNVSATALPTAATTGLAAGDGSVNALSPDFEIPYVWRGSLGADVEFALGDVEGFLFTFDALFDDRQDSPFWFDASCVTPVSQSQVDGRPIYNCSTARQDIVVRNVDGGGGTTLSFSLENEFDNGVSFWLNYTNQDIDEVHPGTSSTATSNYSDHATSDRQNPLVRPSNYEIEHQINARLGWRHAFFGEYETRAELFMERRSGRNFSYTYGYSEGPGRIYRRISPFGINERAADDEGTLFYVPMTDANGQVTMTSDPRINYTAGFDITGFNSYLQQTGLIRYAGQIAPANGFQTDWSTIFDLRLTQEIPAFFPQAARGIFYMDIENFGNLLNDDWGRYDLIGYEYFQPVVELYQYDPVAGTYTYDDARGVPHSNEFRISRRSLWQIQFGVRYEF
ncbi:TonB-dependent receptor [Hyphobacterium sp. HN65]|uniref:TonB-dependent receptor n=1 Tax=Hyphobacterium lacteum TaxID=3116575 RepID=A0ABU7LQD5_9PROT|nr:TonB-dependent receptor [Hyphobacterium sp. HN65]MEE2525554.1 TonB-dependent receptor [Hyphobacterium sp. HN65]